MSTPTELRGADRTCATCVHGPHREDDQYGFRYVWCNLNRAEPECRPSNACKLVRILWGDINAAVGLPVEERTGRKYFPTEQAIREQIAMDLPVEPEWLTSIL